MATGHKGIGRKVSKVAKAGGSRKLKPFGRTVSGGAKRRR